MTTTTLKKMTGAIAIAIAMAMAGCGGGDDDDAPTVDSGMTADGGMTADSAALTPDSSTVVVQGGASLVLGQSEFDQGGVNAGGLGMAGFNRPVSVTAGGGRLWVSDETNQRVLQWNAMPTVNKAAANLAFGMPDLGASGRMFSDGVRVIVSDPEHARVLIWNQIPAVTNAPPTLILGTDGDISGSQIAEPLGSWTDGTKLIITDAGNHRVLIWNTFPVAGDQEANVVLGQPDMVTNVAPLTPTATAIDNPKDVVFANGKLYVVDAAMNRVMVWNGIPTANNTPAAYVIGQEDMISNGAATGAGGLNEPAAIAVSGDKLVISDAGNRRVLVFNPIPTTFGGQAVKVFGQDTMDEIIESPLPAANRFIQPRGVAIVGNKLFVVDQNWNRVLRFDL